MSPKSWPIAPLPFLRLAARAGRPPAWALQTLLLLPDRPLRGRPHRVGAQTSSNTVTAWLWGGKGRWQDLAAMLANEPGG